MDVFKGQTTSVVSVIKGKSHTSGEGLNESDILVSASQCARRSKWLHEAFYEEKVYALVLRPSDTCLVESKDKRC